MASFEIVLGASAVRSSIDTQGVGGDEPDLLDVVVDGEHFSAASEPEQAACLLRELVSAAIGVVEGRTRKALVPLCDVPWELCLTAGGTHVGLSFYRTGPLPEVRLLDHPVPASQLAAQARGALTGLRPRVGVAFGDELDVLVTRLEAAALTPALAPSVRPDVLFRWRSEPHGDSLRVALETVLASDASGGGDAVRADLHALLFRGRIRFEARGVQAELAPGFVFLQLERLVALCAPLLDASAARRALHLRVAAGDSMLALRLASDGSLALTLARGTAPTLTIPALTVPDFVGPVVDAALALARAARQSDPGRARNLRLRAVRADARGVRRQLADMRGREGKVNQDPEPYRVSAVPPSASATASTPPGIDLGSAMRLRYVQRWRAEVEGIDLRGTLLCGDRLVVSGARETAAFDRRTGQVLWSRAFPRAATALAGGDLLRLTPRGDVELRDVGNGEVVWSSRIAPRVGAPALAHTINATGVPRLVVLAEGERKLVALDLRTGEPRWRHAARNGGIFKMRRVGRLLIVVSGDAAMTALDIASGEVVWRYVGAAPLGMTPALQGDLVIASSGLARKGTTHIVAVDAFSGAVRWRADHVGTAASSIVGTSSAAAIAVTGREGIMLLGHAIEDGALAWKTQVGAGPLPGGALALSAFDDLLVANLPNGRIAAVDTASGVLCWSRILAAPVADDTPRRLDVQLRSGALYVPQSSLAVLRPRDGTVLANVDACDLVPDMLRIDEECALYVGEESGHIGCYELGARLGIVRVVQ